MLELIMKKIVLSSRSGTNEAGKKLRQPVYKDPWKPHEFESKKISNHFWISFKILEKFLSNLKSKKIIWKREI